MPVHVCPVWIGYLLASPIRRWFHNPERIFAPHVRENMTVLDVGCAMGFFSIPLARMVGPGGRVVAVDMQQRMIDSLTRRARRAGVLDRIEARVCPQTSLGLDPYAGRVDLALAFCMVHEVPDPKALIAELHRSLRPGGRLFLVEPMGHVSPAAFEKTLALAQEVGLVELERPAIKRSRSVLLEKPGTDPAHSSGASIT